MLPAPSCHSFRCTWRSAHPRTGTVTAPGGEATASLAALSHPQEPTLNHHITHLPARSDIDDTAAGALQDRELHDSPGGMLHPIPQQAQSCLCQLEMEEGKSLHFTLPTSPPARFRDTCCCLGAIAHSPASDFQQGALLASSGGQQPSYIKDVDPPSVTFKTNINFYTAG